MEKCPPVSQLSIMGTLLCRERKTRENSLTLTVYKKILRSLHLVPQFYSSKRADEFKVESEVKLDVSRKSQATVLLWFRFG